MADSKAAVATAPAKVAPASTKPAGKRNIKRMLIIGLPVVLAAAGAGAWLLLRPHDDAASAAASAAAAEKEKIRKPTFVELDAFTVNLKDPDTFLQIKLTFQLKDAASAEGLKEVLPIVRSALIPVLSSQDAADLMTNEGKGKLARELGDAASQALASGELKDAVQTVLITHMIIQ